MSGCGQKWTWESNFNEWMNLVKFLHANTYLRKLKVTLIVIGWVWSNMVCSFRSKDSLISCISRMNEWIVLIFCILVHGVRKASYFGYAHGQIWLRRLRSWDSKICLSQLKSKAMNWADFLNVGRNGIIFG